MTLKKVIHESLAHLLQLILADLLVLCVIQIHALEVGAEVPKDALVVDEFELLFALLVLDFALHAHLGRAGRHRLIYWGIGVVPVAGCRVMVF